MVVEGEEEIGSRNLLAFFQRAPETPAIRRHRRLRHGKSETGLPSITYALRGIVAVTGRSRERRIAGPQRHGRRRAGRRRHRPQRHPVAAVLGQRPAADSALLRQGSSADARSERQALRTFARRRSQVARRSRHPARRRVSRSKPESSIYEQTWRKPAVTVIAQEASSIKGASNQVLPTASAPSSVAGSCRIRIRKEVFRAVEDGADRRSALGRAGDGQGARPAGQMVDDRSDTARPSSRLSRPCAKASARDPISIGCGGTIGFVGPLAELFGGAPALLLGIEDPKSNAHAPNESLHEGDWKNLMRSLAHLFANLGR